MAFNYMLPLRGAQALFALIVLGTTGYGKFARSEKSLLRERAQQIRLTLRHQQSQTGSATSPTSCTHRPKSTS